MSIKHHNAAELPDPRRMFTGLDVEVYELVTMGMSYADAVAAIVDMAEMASNGIVLYPYVRGGI